MEGNLRKHILSEYTSPAGVGIANSMTTNMATVEISDSDEIMRQSEGPTGLTEDIEMSDPDEFRTSGPTLFTKSNSDRILMDQTKHTYTIETSDEDEFLLM